MVKKIISYTKNTFTITYDFKSDHSLALFLIKANNGRAEFEQRSEKKLHDIDGNEISWKVCDELVDMGLLVEDEEEFNVVFNITESGKELLTLLK